jgi:hypothetical protein
MDTSATPDRAGVSWRRGNPLPQDGDGPRAAAAVAPARRRSAAFDCREPRPCEYLRHHRDPLLTSKASASLPHSSDLPLFVATQRTKLYSIAENSGTDPLCRHYQVDLIGAIAIASGRWPLHLGWSALTPGPAVWSPLESLFATVPPVISLGD